MIPIRLSRPADAERILAIWRTAVDATHGFLGAEDRLALEELVSDFLPQAALWLAVDEDDRSLAFMHIDDGHMEALFVDPAFRGSGLGTALVQHGLSLHPRMTTDVNEQNRQAVRFYQRLGFFPIGRSHIDGQGRPYPLIHLEYAG